MGPKGPMGPMGPMGTRGPRQRPHPVAPRPPGPTAPRTAQQYNNLADFVKSFWFVRSPDPGTSIASCKPRFHWFCRSSCAKSSNIMPVLAWDAFSFQFIIWELNRVGRSATEIVKLVPYARGALQHHTAIHQLLMWNIQGLVHPHTNSKSSTNSLKHCHAVDEIN